MEKLARAKQVEAEQQVGLGLDDGLGESGLLTLTLTLTLSLTLTLTLSLTLTLTLSLSLSLSPPLTLTLTLTLGESGFADAATFGDYGDSGHSSRDGVATGFETGGFGGGLVRVRARVRLGLR